MYGNLESGFGMIIGVLIGIIIIFLICRELVCWYWKINKIVALMEEQNNLIKKYFSTNSITQNNINVSSISETTENKMELKSKIIENKEVKVNSLFGLRSAPGYENKNIQTIQEGETVIVLEEVEGWTKVKTSKNIEGWLTTDKLLY